MGHSVQRWSIVPNSDIQKISGDQIELQQKAWLMALRVWPWIRLAPPSHQSLFTSDAILEHEMQRAPAAPLRIKTEASMPHRWHVGTWPVRAASRRSWYFGPCGCVIDRRFASGPFPSLSIRVAHVTHSNVHFLLLYLSSATSTLTDDYHGGGFRFRVFECRAFAFRPSRVTKTTLLTPLQYQWG